MRILPQALPAPLARAADALATALFPASCLLCGGDGARPVLCPGCQADLPSLPTARCPRCAEPTTHGEHCGRCLHTPPHFDATCALYPYEFPADRLIHALKYGHQLGLAAWFGKELAARLPAVGEALVVALPLHPRRLSGRGFNQAGEIARALARQRGLEWTPDTLLRTRDTEAQAGLPLKGRAANVRGAFECRRDLGGRPLVLVDDVMTSGATLDEAARVLKLHGAGSVMAAVVARAGRN